VLMVECRMIIPQWLKIKLAIDNVQPKR